MYITAGSIDSLIEWFEKNNRFKFLCLLVAGHAKDIVLFSEVFDRQDTLDTVSGESIAIFLFSSVAQDMLSFQTSEGYVILPCKLIGPKTKNHSYGFVPVSEINPHDLKNYLIRESTIKTSQTISNDIQRKYNLSIYDIPCILFLVKGESEPFIIRTGGQADVEQLIELLKDIHKLEGSKSLLRAEREINNAIFKSQEILEKYGVPKDVCENLVNRKTSRKLWSVLGREPKNPGHSLAIQYSENIEAALTNTSELKQLIRKIIDSAKIINRESNHRESALELMEKISKKYERKFYFKEKYQNFKSFLDVLLGLTSKAKDIKDLLSPIK